MEEKELQEMRDLFAGIALPGIIGRASYLDSPKIVARDAYDIAEAMLVERENRINKTQENESIH